MAVGLLAATARGDLPWREGSRGGDGAPRSRSYIALASAGGYVGYHDSEWRKGTYKAADLFAWDLRALECRFFGERLGGGFSVGQGGASATWNSATLAVPAVSFLCITRNGSHSFDFATLEVPLLLYAPTGLRLAYTTVPFAPWPLEMSVCAGAQLFVGLAFSEEVPGLFAPVALPAWYASLGIRIGAGWWVMRDD
jgi:hypothetical protein